MRAFVDRREAGSGEAARRTEINQTGFCKTGNDLYLTGESLPGGVQKITGVAGTAQGIGADYADIGCGQMTDPLPETGQALKGALSRRPIQTTPCVQAIGKAHHLADAIDDNKFTVARAGHNHMETVGTEIDGGEIFVI